MINSNKISKKILYNSLNDGKISHAYLFELDNSLDNNELIFSFVKNIICPFSKNKKCDVCNICKRIDSGNYTDLKIIEPDGLWIKKEQLIKLQEQFNKKAIESRYMIYIIKDADKMNASAANTILKFLEEPEEGIIAILTTSNVNNMLKTIISRCQILSLKSENTLGNNYTPEEIQIVIDFLNQLEEKKIDTIANLNDIWNNKMKQREDIIKAFDIILLLYTDILNNILTNTCDIFETYKKELENIKMRNTKDTIYKKINIIVDINDKLKYNTNTNLLLDKFIIEFNGVD